MTSLIGKSVRFRFLPSDCKPKPLHVTAETASGMVKLEGRDGWYKAFLFVVVEEKVGGSMTETGQHVDRRFVDELAKGIAPAMLSNEALKNLIIAAVAFGHAAAGKGWTLEQTIEEGKKL